MRPLGEDGVIALRLVARDIVDAHSLLERLCRPLSFGRQWSVFLPLILEGLRTECPKPIVGIDQYVGGFGRLAQVAPEPPACRGEPAQGIGHAAEPHSPD